MTLPSTDLPAWMRPRRRWIDWGLLFVIGIGVLLDWPLAVWPGLPGHTDAALFVARAAEIAASLRSGTLYTRWAADFHFGFGSPLFNYLAPLPHYLSGLHQLITDANPVDSIKLGLALSVILAGVGMYQFVRQRYGLRAGLIASVVYITSTPIAYALPVQSGNLAVLLSLALLPWAMAALDRLVRHPTRREWLTALVILTTWSLTDTRMVVIGLPLVTLVLSNTWSNREARIAVGWLLGAAALLTSFFWLPALVERGAVQWVPLADDPVGGSITLSDSLGGLPLSISTLFNPPIERGLGVGFSLTTIIGAATFIKFRRAGRWPIVVDFSRRRDVIAFGLAGLVAVVLTTPYVAKYWMIATGWQPIRPYDVLLGLALPALTLVASQAACCWPEPNLTKNSAQRWRSSIGFALMSGPALLALLPAFTNVSWLPVSSLDAAVSVHTETAINAIDTLRTGILLPIESYQPETPLDRIVFNNPERDPVGPVPNLLLVNRTPLESRFTLSPLTAEVNLTLDRLAFPGWFVVFNGVPAPNAVGSDGRMLFNIFNPTDTAHGAELLLIFGDTPIRYLSWFLTGLGIFLALGRFLVSPVVLSTADSGISDTGLWYSADQVALAVVFGLFVAVFAVLHLLSNRSSPALLAGSNTSTVATGTPTSSYPVGLTSAVITPENIAPGSTLHITLLWHVFRPISADWELIARLTPVSTDPNAPAVTSSLVTQWHPGDIPTNQWPIGMLIRDPLNIPLSTDIVPGNYYVQVAMAQCASPQRLPCDQPVPIQLTGNKPDSDWLTLSEPLQIEAAVAK